MLTEAMRPTWRISLAIILSFSKFTKPSTLESLPEKQGERKFQLTKLILISKAVLGVFPAALLTSIS